MLVVGASPFFAPFKGGTMVPNPDLLLAPLATDAAGALSLATTWPPGLPTGTALLLQDWIIDAAAPHGWAASNGLQATVP